MPPLKSKEWSSNLILIAITLYFLLLDSTASAQHETNNSIHKNTASSSPSRNDCVASAAIECDVRISGTKIPCDTIEVYAGTCGPMNVTLDFTYCNENEDRAIDLLDWKKTQIKILTKVQQDVNRDDLQPGRCRHYFKEVEVNTCNRGFTASIKVQGWLKNSHKRDGDYCYAYDFMRVIFDRQSQIPVPTLPPSVENTYITQP